MKTDMKFPCLVTCNTIQCIAINENHVIYLEGDYKGEVRQVNIEYSRPRFNVVYEYKPEDNAFIWESIRNSIRTFNTFGIRENSNTIDIDIRDIDFSPWKGDNKLFFDDVDIIKRKQWKPTVGELLFLGEEYFVLKTNGGEAAYSLKNCEITKPVTPESKLKDLWFELGQDIDLFITQVSKEYKEV